MEEFAQEKRKGGKLTPGESLVKFGTRVVPIPVPLEPGETEEQYEAALSVAFADAIKRAVGDEVKERTRRCSFAAMKLAAYKARQKASRSRGESTGPARSREDALPPRPAYKADTRSKLGSELTDESVRAAEKFVRLKTPREELHVKRYVDLDEYRSLVRNGLFARIKGMSVNEREREYGSQIVPIYVPLARGETMAQYEERFVKWLWEKHALTLEELQNHPNPVEERYLRLMFTKANTNGDEYFVPPRRERKHERDEDVPREEKPLKMKKEEPAKEAAEATPSKPIFTPSRRGACLGHDSISSKIACGCRRCLVNGMRSLAAKITAVEATRKEQCELAKKRAVRIEDQPSDTESSASGSTSPPRSGPSACEDADPILDALIAKYDAINEQIVMNENVLDASAARLATTPMVDVQETTQIQDEDQEMRDLIREEMKNRSMALATLVVYMWRDNVDELTKMVIDVNASDMIHVQRAAHHKCAQLATEWATKRLAFHQLQAEGHPPEGRDSSKWNERLRFDPDGEDVLAQLRAIHDQRRREFVRLIHFDQHIRQLIQAALAKVDG